GAEPGGRRAHVPAGRLRRRRVDRVVPVRAGPAPGPGGHARRAAREEPRMMAGRTDDLAEAKAQNSRLLREDIAAGRTFLRGLPEIVALHTTERCNLRCTMCERSISRGELQLPRARLAAICDDLFPTARKVALSGAKGEPLLADFDLVAQKAREH